MKVEILDLFLERNSLYNFKKLVNLPITQNELSDDELISFFQNDIIFMEAILIARPNLYFLIQTYLKGKLKIKKVRRLSQTLYKYYLRVCSRPTPYGLFNTVNFRSNFIFSEYILKRSEIKKHVRISFDWLAKIMKKIELDRDCNALLQFSLNRALIYNEVHIENPFISFQDSTNLMYNARIARVDLLNKLLEYCRDRKYFSVYNLKEYISLNFNMSLSDSYKIVELLIDGEFIISELRQSPDMCNDYLDNILTVLRMRNLQESDWFRYLHELNNKILNYSILPLGCGVSEVLDIYGYMSDFCHATRYLHVELEEINQGVLKNSEFGDLLYSNLEDLLNFLSSLNNSITTSLDYYKQLFLEKYGTDNSVPLLELLYSEGHIGLPLGYINPSMGSLVQANAFQVRENSVKKIVKQLLVKAIHSRQDYVDLFDNRSLFDFESETFEGTRYMEIALSILESADKPPEITIAPSLGSQTIGAMIGRFTYMLSGEVLESYQKLYNDEKYNNSIPVVEISELPNLNSLGDIVKNNSFRDYKILSNLFDNGLRTLSLDSISIGVNSKNRKWYIYSNELQSEIVVRNSSYLNPLYFSNATRLLIELSNNNLKDMFDIFDNLDMGDFEYQPRIRFKNIVLKPRVWKFFKIDSDIQFVEFVSRLLKWKVDWLVPEIVYLVDLDKRLPISFVDDRSLEIAYSEFVRKGTLQFQEIGKVITEETLTDFELKEVIVQVKLKGGQRTEQKHTKILDNKSNPIQVTSQNYTEIVKTAKEKNKYWSSILIFLKKSSINDFLLNYLSPFISDMADHNIIGNFYYLIFNTDDSHIKLKFDNRKLNVQIVYKWLSDLINDGVISSYKVEPYLPEIEKFGGIECFERYEKLRSYENFITLQVLALSNDEKIVASCIYMMHIMSQFGLNNYEKIQFLEDELGKERLPEWYMLNKSHFLNKIIVGEKRKTNTLTNSAVFLESYIQQINYDDENKKLTNFKNKILFHVFHQFCNRSNIDLKLEYELKIVVLAVCRTIYYKS